MAWEQLYFRIISDTQWGWLTIPQIMLRVASLFYGCVVWCRNRLFDWGWRNSERASVPVISVGNLTTGGTGKTPIVAYLARLCQDVGADPGLISRGYRSVDGVANDEKMLLDLLLPGVNHVQHRRRVEAAQELLSKSPEVHVIVMDDGFQHRQLHRDLDLVVVDATNPFGYGWLLPGGLLREPIAGLRRADVVCVSRVDQVKAPRVEEIKTTLRRWVRAEVPILSVTYEATRLLDQNRGVHEVSILRGASVTAFCGIGAPANFFETVRQLGVELDQSRTLIFPDHHHFGMDDMRRICAHARDHQSQDIVMTLKDYVKMEPLLKELELTQPVLQGCENKEAQGMRFYALEIEARLTAQERSVLAAMVETCMKKASS